MSVDFPRAWEIANATPLEGHDLCCSYRVTIGAMLCDCPVLTGHPEYADDMPHGRGGAVRTVG